MNCACYIQDELWCRQEAALSLGLSTKACRTFSYQG
jgi:hypothetical protein